MKQTNKIEWRTIAIKVLIVILLIFSFAISVSATISTGNSKNSITNIEYYIDVNSLGLSNTYTTQVQSNTTIINNITKTIDYSCTLDSGQEYLQTGTANPSDVIFVNQTVSQLTYGIHNISLECEYAVNTNHQIITIDSYFDSGTNQTLNVTNIVNNNSISSTTQNSSKTIIIDNTIPSLTLISPIAQTFNTSNLSYAVTFNFTVLDISHTNCSINYFSANGSNEINLGLVSSNYLTTQNFAIGNYTYNITCIDILENKNHVQSTFNIASNNTLVQEPVLFNISLTKPSFNIGEIGQYIINANNNSNVTITICPTGSGWVQCYATPAYINEIFPKTQSLPYSNKTGVYTIEAVMKYKNYTLTYNTSYTIINSMTASITVSKSTSGVNDIVVFNATALGGIGSYTYNWRLHDGTTFTGPGAFKNYTSAGTHQINLTVNDSAGNQYNTTASVNIKNYYKLNVIVSDKSSGSRIENATVTIDEDDDLEKYTDSSGTTSFRLLSKKYDVYVSKNGYGGYLSEVDLDEDLTVYMNLTLDGKYPPKVTLLTDDKMLFVKETVKLKFKANDNGNVGCALYVAKGSDSWFTQKDSGDNLLSDTEYTFELNDLLAAEYKWKVECYDSDNSRAYSDERTFTLADSLESTMTPTEKNSNSINSALDNMNALSGDESVVAQILGIPDDLQDLLEKIDRMDKDLHDVTFRRDLDAEGKEALKESIVKSVEDSKYSTPVDIKVTGSKNFVKYVRDDALSELLQEYSSIKSLNINNKAFLEATKRAQGKATISTKVRNVVLYYLNGETKEITLVTREIKPIDESLASSKSITFVELIPKDIASSMSEIVVLNKEYTVLKDDPIIEFNPDTESINYYIKSNIDLEMLEKSDTVIIDKDITSIKSATGLAILGVDALPDIELSGQTIMIVLIILLLIFYVIMHFEVLDKLKNVGFGSKKKVTYIRVLINDALDYIEAEDYEKAELVYREIKLAYEDSNNFVKKQVYDDSYDICNQLDLSYANYLLARTESYIKQENKNAALLEFEKLDKTFSKMSDSYKNKVSDQFRSIINRLKTLS